MKKINNLFHFTDTADATLNNGNSKLDRSDIGTRCQKQLMGKGSFGVIMQDLTCIFTVTKMQSFPCNKKGFHGSKKHRSAKLKCNLFLTIQ